MTDFDAVHERRGTGSSKWSKYPDDVLPMWVADMDFPAAPEIVDAIRNRLEHPMLGYGVARDELRARIVADMQEKYGWTVSPDEIVFLPGVVPGFNMALHAMLEPGDGVLVQPPVYRPILEAPADWNLVRREAPLLPTAEGHVMDTDVLAAELAKSKALLFCNPQNPTGKVFTTDELKTIADLCRQNDTLIISDEIHCDLLFDGRRHVPIATLSEDAANRTITLMAASKTYNIAGLKTAFAIVGNKTIREKFNQARLGMVDNANIIGLEATLAAFSKAGDWKTRMLAYIEANRDYLSAEIARRFPKIKLIKSEGTFLAWLDCTELGLKPDAQSYFLEHGKVGFNAGSEFGKAYGNFVRVNFGCPRTLLEEGLSRMERAIGRNT
ncbi:MalY/PatB family protein [Neorhizobium galegae]|uniref:MalY/PatB family protein n=1 Tax=Neorhizobium galegae TaxID=399 RepID=UPI000622A11E|nr:PatB family C-S lyase [Neorhizobium galegae]CDZ29580.1 Cystathionine beta-lyase PatB [Neorhizobium galegae bv. officinalis]KAA9388605.1 putative C-S lyase [Neorhizobium galegae]KAB1114001.1 putative C-S lyase [Neorhizobium galegae]MCM2501000.1 PatB family C-S lyase [Neorhizobium galegae]MCQ1770998.1 PatB family C-S lyase [Neorhizobium galegae]